MAPQRQLEAHAPQPLHRASLTTATRLTRSTVTALAEHTASQVPQAVHLRLSTNALSPADSTISLDKATPARPAAAFFPVR